MSLVKNRNLEAFQIRQELGNGLLGIAKSDSPSNSVLETDLVGLRHTSIFGNLDPSVRRLQCNGYLTDVTDKVSKFGRWFLDPVFDGGSHGDLYFSSFGCL